MYLLSTASLMLALWTINVSTAAVKPRSDFPQNDCNLPDGDSQGADCDVSSADAVIRARQDLPLGLTTIQVGTGITTSETTIALVLPYTASLDPIGDVAGSGILVTSSPITSAKLMSKDVLHTSDSAFNSASCDFYTSSTTVSGLVACYGDHVGFGSTSVDVPDAVVSLSGEATCLACVYATGEGGEFDKRGTSH